MRHVLRVAGASFERGGLEFVPPFDARAAAGEHVELEFSSRSEASLAARMCAGIVKPSRGSVYIGEYDSRLQPAQAKRYVGFVDASGFRGSARTFTRQIKLRISIWGMESESAWARAIAVSSALHGAPEHYARAVALAMAAGVALLVLDQPPEGVAEAIAALRPEVAIASVGHRTFRALTSPQPAGLAVGGR